MLRPVVPALALALLAACGTASSSGRQAAARVPAAPAVTPAPPPAATPSPEILLARARALREEGDVAGAQERLEAAYAAAPAAADVRLELADLLVSEGRDLERAGALLAAIPLQDGVRPNLVAGRLAELRGDDGATVEAYARALSLADDPDVRLRRALALERLGRGDEAIAELERVRASRPGDAAVSARLAERYEAAGRLGEAEAELRAAAEAQPDRAAGWERLARFYARAGRTAKMKDALAKARQAGARSERPLRPLLPSSR
jgi:predicted Zn-dependent protease